MQEQIGKVTIQYREEEILLQTEALEDARIRESDPVASCKED